MGRTRWWHDLVWYLSQRPPLQPNLTLLQHALDQTKPRARGTALPPTGAFLPGSVWTRSIWTPWRRTFPRFSKATKGQVFSALPADKATKKQVV